MKTISRESFILFNEQLSSMLGLDLPLPESLRQVSFELQDKRLATTLAEVIRDVERGKSYAEAVDKRASELPELYGAMVKAGEESGNLAEILRQTASYHHDMMMLENKVKANLIYPGILTAALVLLLLLYGLHVVPRMATIFASVAPRDLLGPYRSVSLPWPTRLLVWFGGSYLFPALCVCAAAAGWRYRQRIAHWWEANQFMAPVWGDLMLSAYIARICRTLGVLLKSGVALNEALLLTEKTLPNRVVAESFQAARRSVTAGKKLGASLSAAGFFPPAFTWMVGMAEEREGVERCLLEAGEYYQHRVERRSQLLARLVEPALLVMFGVIFGFLVIAYFGPLIMPVFGGGEY
ncbi:MAG: type II secretion system F family protein [Elusimicrobia bacterium]|nr:type II secretion system F family protein [Elusimicrobiota bacterium]